VVLDGLARILDAPGLEELFACPDEEATFLYDLLVDMSQGRSSTIYWEICRSARRRGLTPEYVIDRAAILISSMEERRRTDLYRILDVPPLASGEMLRQRWLEVVKRAHPDAGGEGATFRRVKEAYEVLRDPDRRSEYERFWLRALGPFERVAPAADRPLQESARLVVVRTSVPPPSREQHDETPALGASFRSMMHAAAQVLAERESLERRLAGGGVNGLHGLGSLITRFEAEIAAVSAQEIESLVAEAEREIALLEGLRARFAQVATLKERLAG
jgi:DnaJ-like protein